MNPPLEDEPIELEPIEEDETAAIFAPDKSILECPGVVMAVRNYAGSSYPCCVLDPALQIVWSNAEFQRVFPTSGAAHIIALFPQSFDDERRRALYSELRSKATGYSWRGEIELQQSDRARLIAHLLVGPIRRSGADAAPQAYLAIVDDITDHHRNLIRNTFSSLLEASLLKDNDTGRHVSRVNEYSRLLSERIAETGRAEEIDFEFIDTISFVAAMHDVGKIGTPDDILNKDGPLEEWEWDVMKEHTINGAYILNTYPALMAKQIALFHHERWDGGGYPYQMSGEMIPTAARIVALADVYDALRMKRSYKPAFPHEKACEEIENGLGSHFDPDFGGVFLAAEETMRDVYERLGD